MSQHKTPSAGAADSRRRCGQGAAVAKIKLQRRKQRERKAIKARRVYECDARTFVRRLDTFQQHNEGLISANNEVALHYYYSYFRDCTPGVLRENNSTRTHALK